MCKRIYIFLISLIYAVVPCNAQQQFTITPINKSTTVFPFLDSVLTHNKIIALGESSHSTHEFFAIKAQIIKYAITKHNINTIGIEADYIGTKKANSFLLNKHNNVKQALYDLGIQAWSTTEMQELFNWIAAYNLNATDNNKVQLFGFDYRGTNGLISYLLNTSKTIHFVDTAALLALNTKSINPKSVESIKNKILNYIHQINLSKDSAEEIALCLNALTALAQNAQLAPNSASFSNNRDIWMYENIMHHYQEGKKIIIWAHNEHIAKTSGYKRHIFLGEFLANQFKSMYFSIGLLTYQGSLSYYNKFSKKIESQAIPQTFVKGIENLLAQQEQEDFFIHTNQLKITKAKFKGNWNLRVRSSKNGTYFIEKSTALGSIPNKFDAILFFKNTTRSQLQ